MKRSGKYQSHGGVIAAFFLAGILAISSGCSFGQAAEPDAGTPPISVEIAKVERRNIARTLTYSGDIVGEVEIRVFSTIPERIISLNVEEGQAIEQGDLIATIRADALGQGVRQAQGGLASARAQVAGLRDTLARQQRLLTSGVVTQAAVDGTRYQLQAAEAQVAQLEATVGSAQSRRSDANIRSPLTGIVGQVFVEEGDLAAPQVPLCTVVQMDRVEVLIQVPERDLGHVRPGMQTTIEIGSVQGRTFTAPVSRISPVVDRSSRTATLRIVVENPNHIIRPGSLADVTIAVERHENVIVVPQYSLVLDERTGENGLARFRAYVLRSEGNIVEERQVRVGIYEGDSVEVLEGLRVGEQLIVQGQHLLRNGSRVTVRRTESRQRGEEQQTPAAGNGD